MASGQTAFDTVRLRLEPDPSRLGAARRWVRTFLVESQVPGAVTDDVVLAASELMTNAVESSEPDSEVLVEIRVERAHRDRSAGAAVELVVENVGPGFEVEEDPELPGPYAARGRGLAIATRLVDLLEVERLGDTNRVRAVRTIPEHDTSADTGR